MKNAGKACNNRLYRHIRTFEKIIKNYFVIYVKGVYMCTISIHIPEEVFLALHEDKTAFADYMKKNGGFGFV